MLIFDPEKAKVPEIHKLLLGGVAPRPIALVSTLSPDGIRNLSPFSFYNVFGANPPYIAFSPARRGRDGTFKDTYNNLIASGECVVNAVTYEMVEKVSYASTEFPPDVDEFQESGLNALPSVKVKPFRVAESPFQMECILDQMINLGTGHASGNLAICKVILIHTEDHIFDNGIISPEKIDLVARMAGDYYCRSNGESVFKVRKPSAQKGIGYTALPEKWKKSTFLTANEIGKLCNLESLPTLKEINDLFVNQGQEPGKHGGKPEIDLLISRGEFDNALSLLLDSDIPERQELLIILAKRYLSVDELSHAAKILSII